MATAAHLSEHLPFHRNVLATEKGPWLIRVNAVLTAHESENASLHLVLEDLSHEPRSKDRKTAAFPCRVFRTSGNPARACHDLPSHSPLGGDLVRGWVSGPGHGTGIVRHARVSGSSRYLICHSQEVERVVTT